jgi:hypothetical protein
MFTFTYNESIGGSTGGTGNGDDWSSTTIWAWTAQFDLATHPVSPFTTPSPSVAGFLTPTGVPTILWSGDRMVSIHDTPLHDNLTNISWGLDS